MFTIILLLVIAGLCFAYLRSAKQAKSAKDDAKCWELLARMYWDWYEASEVREDRITQERDDAWLAIEIMALGLMQERRDFEACLAMVLEQKEHA